MSSLTESNDYTNSMQLLRHARGFVGRAVTVSLLAMAAACTSSSDDGAGGKEPGTATTATSTSTGIVEVEACDAHVTGGVASFTDQVDAWGLTGVVGTRMDAADLNNDGYPDLVVHQHAPNQRQLKEGAPARLIYVLMNEAKPGGGRVFVDRTIESGYAALADSTTELKASVFAIFGDVDNDGDLDAFSGTWTDYAQVQTPPRPVDLDRSAIYLNDGTGKLTLLADSGVAPMRGLPTTGASFVDANLDGKLDLFVGYHRTTSDQAPSIYYGTGDGHFIDGSAGLRSFKRAAFGVTACDVDGDGISELLMSAYARGPDVLLKLNLSTGAYEDLGVVSNFAFDDNKDYTDNEFFKCWCTVHDTDPLCEGIPNPQVGCPAPADANWSPVSETKDNRLGGNTFSTVCSDITGDGKLDVYHAEIAHWWAGQSSDKSNLLVNRSEGGNLLFERVDRAQYGLEVPHVGVDWNEGGLFAAAADLDNDGREDILLGTSDYPDQYGYFFHQKPDGMFELLEQQGFHHPCVAGMAVADFDRDGDLDIVVGSGRARDCAEIWPTNEVHLYENDAAQKGSYVSIRLVGGASTNRAAIGARVTVDTGTQTLVKELGVGSGHLAMQHDTVVTFGLGACEAVKSITVRWPDGVGSTSVYENVPVRRFIELRQDSPEVFPVFE